MDEVRGLLGLATVLEQGKEKDTDRLEQVKALCKRAIASLASMGVDTSEVQKRFDKLSAGAASPEVRH
jgi:hypothetical protein